MRFIRWAALRRLLPWLSAPKRSLRLEDLRAGNAYVTEAKRQVSRRPDGAAIDMPAGPSEVLVIADAEADPRFVAADLLSQAEHGPDSQVVLLTPSKTLAKAVAQAAAKELETLPRRAIAEKSLSASRLIVVKDLKECVEVSNRYAPEHLILQTRNARGARAVRPECRFGIRGGLVTRIGR